MNRSVVALITATISPAASVPVVAVADKTMREQQYREGLRAILRNNNVRQIYFVENSGFLREGTSKGFITEFSPAVRFLDIDVTDIDPSKGKGALEIATIRRALELMRVEADQLVVKITGRYRVANWREYTEGLMTENAEVVGSFRQNLTFFDTRVFAAVPRFYTEHIAGFESNLDDVRGFYLEHAVARAVHRMMMLGDGDWRAPNPPPLLRGVSGSTGMNIRHSVLRDAYHVLVARILSKLLR